MSSFAIETAFPLTPLQQAVVLASVRNPDGSLYQVQCQVDLRGDVDPEILAEAWRRLIRRHAAFRSFFAWDGREEPLQVVRADATLPWTAVDWREVDADEQERRWNSLRAADATTPFDLARAPILRLHLARLGDERFRLLWSLHHALADGWSALRVLREMVEEYDAVLAGEELERPAPPPFGLFVSWLEARDRQEAEEYWREKLRGVGDASPLPAPRPSDPGPHRETVEVELGRELSEAVTEAAGRMRVTPYTLLLGAWSLVLARHAPDDDSITFGTTVTERPAEIPEVGASVGMYLNTVPLRIPRPGSTGIREWLEAIQRTAMDARHHGVSGLGEITGWADLEPGAVLARSLVIHESFPDAVQALPRGRTFQLEGLRVSAPSDLPLALLGHPGASMRLELAYDTALYTREDAEGLLALTRRALEGLSDPRIGGPDEVELLGREERRTLLEEWGRSPVPEPEAPDVLDAFDAAVATTPDAPAVRDDETTLSYRELDRAANRLARRLATLGLGADALIGVPGRPETGTIVSILACLKAGVGYVPFDPDQPEARLNHILASVDRVLTREVDDRWPAGTVSTDGLESEPSAPPPLERDPKRIAYVIFTSGSTGRPKAVVVERGQLARSTAARLAWYDGRPERFLLLSSLAVDSSVAGLYWTLCTGGCLVLAPARAEQDAEALADRIAAESVTTTLMVPGLWRTLLEEVPPARMSTLECVVVAGEACTPALVARHHRQLPGVRLVNEYGPSEATVWATAEVLTPEPGARGVSIGRPVPFVRVYLLDAQGRLVPPGAPGEICLAGETVARGYLGADEESEARFVPDPFVPGGRMYRTGDRGRFRRDGRLDFLGRVDHQLKIRGYRVEPGEIESVLATAPGVREVGVVVCQRSAGGATSASAQNRPTGAPGARPGSEELVAAIRAGEPRPTEDDLRRYARARLPGYMVPRKFVFVDSMPQAATGKLDRRALTARAASLLRDADSRDAGSPEGRASRLPRTRAEKTLAAIWASVLGLDEVFVDDDFFELGGHSLLSIRAIARAKQAGLPIDPRQFFATPTIAALAAVAEAGPDGDGDPDGGTEGPPETPGPDRDVGIPTVPSGPGGRVPLSFAQEGFWFLDRLDPGDRAYNIAVRLDLRGPLNPDRLAQSYRQVLERHDALRSTVHFEEGQPWLRALPGERFALEGVDFSDLSDPEARVRSLSREMARHRFELEGDPLVRGVLARLAPDHHALLLSLHHMTVDGDSLTRVLADLGAAYRQGATGNGASPPDSTPEVSYQAYAAWERDRWSGGGTAEEGLGYWSERLADTPERIAWPPDDREGEPGAGGEGATRRRQLPSEVADAVGAFCQARGCTPFVLLLAAYQVLLHRHSGQDVVVVGAPVTHRPHPALEGAVGYFQNLLPLRGDLSANPTFSAFVSQIREAVAGALAHADVPFEKIVEVVTPRRTAEFTPLFQTALIFRDGTQADGWRSALELPGVEVEASVLHNGGAKFELSLEIERTGDGLSVLAEYAEDRFGAAAVARLLDRFEVLLQGALDAPDRPVSTLPVMTPEERRRTLVGWSTGASKGPGPRVFVLDARGRPVPPGVPGELCIAGLPLAPQSAGGDAEARAAIREATFPEAAGAPLYHTGKRVRFRPDGTLVFLPPQPGTRDAAGVPDPARPRAAEASDGPGPHGTAPREGSGGEPRRASAPRGFVEQGIAALWREVLGVAEVGRDDDFFGLGGHSLKAISVLVRLEEAFGVEVPLAAFFESPTVAGLARLVGSLSPAGTAFPEATPTEGEGETDRYPLSPDQSRLWYLQQLDPESPAYHVPLAYRLTGPLDVRALRAALDRLVRRHDALRTTVDAGGGGPVQVVHPPSPVPLPLTELPEDAPEAAIREVIEAEAVAPFDLERGPLLRARLVRRGSEHHLVLTFHHLVADGWSLGLVAREISEGYAQAREVGEDVDPGIGAPAEGPADGATDDAPPHRWGPWCSAQTAWLESDACEGELAFWRERLRDVPPLELPTDHLRPDRPSYRGATHAFRLSRELSERLEARCRAAGVTPFAGLLSAYKVLLHRYAGQTDLAVGTVVAGRRSVASEGMVGLFANTVVVRTELDPSWDTDELLTGVGRRAVEALAHQRVPFGTVVEAVRPRRDPSRNPLFQVAFLLQNQEAGSLQLPGLEVEEESVETGTAKFDLTFAARRRDDGYALILEYASDLFRAETIERMAGHLETLITAMAEGFSGPVRTLPMVQDPTEWTLSGPTRARSGQALHTRISEQARRTPDAVAVTDEAGVSVGYRELDIRSHRIGVALVARGIGPGDVVGVGLPRNADLVAALLGILKAGAAYLPLDPDLPPTRLEHIQRDAGASLLVTTAELQDRFPPGPPPVLLSTLLEDTLSGAEPTPRPDAPDFPGVEPEALAYLIYTSGSTGGPKGVEVAHGNAVNLLDTMAVRPGLDAGTRWLAVTTLSFDISLLEIFGPLSVGGEVVLASAETAADGRALAALLSRINPTHMQATPATWRMLLDVGWKGDGHLKALVGGEALPPELARELSGPCSEVWNMYGPTETTVWSTCGRVDGSGGPIQVGTPVANTRVYLLDDAGQPVPRGVPGELYIAGAGVAVGYRNRPELTAERFLPDPFAVEGGRMYRTGDRVRLLPDGTLEILGRLDGQVKIRGFRIETGEVEATLEAHPAVRRAVVRAFATGTPDARLVAFAVPDPERGVSGSELRRFVRERLPRYMVPSMISLLDALPLTPNGKVDRRALVDPLEAGRPATAGYEPPSSPLEETIATVWSELLGGVKVGRGDNFFELGGHSLLSIRAVGEIRRRAGHELDPRAFFFQSVEQLAAGREDDGSAQ